LSANESEQGVPDEPDATFEIVRPSTSACVNR